MKEITLRFLLALLKECVGIFLMFAALAAIIAGISMCATGVGLLGGLPTIAAGIVVLFATAGWMESQRDELRAATGDFLLALHHWRHQEPSTESPTEKPTLENTYSSTWSRMTWIFSIASGAPVSVSPIETPEDTAAPMPMPSTSVISWMACSIGTFLANFRSNKSSSDIEMELVPSENNRFTA